ncbi:hypothetical protein D5086_013845 [Populus alba]|uniref:Uncharacterized protein n=1 Tax=Populus alba TaxID=43335 RepID=A0ACC4C6S3_POPAL
MSLKFNSPFLGIPVIAPLNGRNRPNSVYSGRGQLSKRGFRKCICVKKHSDWVAQALRFSHFCGKDVELARNANESGVECVKESFVQNELVRIRTSMVERSRYCNCEWMDHIHLTCSPFHVLLTSKGLVCSCKLWIEMFSRGNLVLIFLSHRLLEYSRVNWQSPYRRVMASIISSGSELEAQLGRRLRCKADEGL